MSALWQQDGAYYGSLLDCHFRSSACSSSTFLRIKLHNPAWAPCKSHPETRWMVSNWQMHHIHPAWHSLDKKLATTCEFRVKSVPCECEEGNAHVSLSWTIFLYYFPNQFFITTLNSFFYHYPEQFFCITTLNSFFVSLPWTFFLSERWEEARPHGKVRGFYSESPSGKAPILPLEPLI